MAATASLPLQQSGANTTIYLLHNISCIDNSTDAQQRGRSETAATEEVAQFLSKFSKTIVCARWPIGRAGVPPYLIQLGLTRSARMITSAQSAESYTRDPWLDLEAVKRDHTLKLSHVRIGI
ncbi:hypothetical protein [Mesorhizobium tamadayense]|uniref:hypothetical protein n=1 Tax=Mesorhizobium tamadayense TaxID=425306 RepID=UPI00142D6C89|nr:hypothetical protein [Mesorhizobium tamadayense]